MHGQQERHAEVDAPRGRPDSSYMRSMYVKLRLVYSATVSGALLSQCPSICSRAVDVDRFIEQ